MTKFRKDNYRNNGKVYRCVYNGKMTLRESEMEEGKFVSVEEAKKMMSKGMLSPSATAMLEGFLTCQKCISTSEHAQEHAGGGS